MPIPAANISSGIGTGEAQVFRPYESNYGAKAYDIYQQKEDVRRKRESDVYNDLGKVKVEGIFFKHQPVFAQKQKDLYEYVKNNIDALRKGDADKTIEYQQMLTKLGTDIGLSKEASKEYVDIFKEYSNNQGKYDDNVMDELNKFGGYDPNSDQFDMPDRGWLQEKIDLGKDARENLVPLFDKIKKESQTAVPQSDGSVRTVKTEDLTEDDVKNVAVNFRLNDPRIHAQAYRDYKKVNPDTEPTDEDLKGFYFEKYGKPFIKSEKFTTLTKGEGKGMSLMFGGGNTAENDDVRVVVKDTPEKRVYDIAQIKTTENSIMDFSLSDGTVVKGTPLRIERYKSTGGKDVVISVPEMADEIDDITGEPTGKKVKTGKNYEKRVPYKLNENRVFKGKFNFSIDDIDKGITEKGVEVKKGESKGAIDEDFLNSIGATKRK